MADSVISGEAGEAEELVQGSVAAAQFSSTIELPPSEKREGNGFYRAKRKNKFNEKEGDTMSGLLKKSALTIACGLALSAAAQAADTTISGGGVTARINDQGTFASYQDLGGGGPAMGSPGLRYNGVEFVNIDVPLSWWWLSAGGANYVSSLGNVVDPLPNATVTASAGNLVVTSNLPSGLGLVEVWSITGPGKLSVSVQLSNAGSSDLRNVQWGVGLDPDQGGSGNNATLNTILGLGNVSAVSAAIGSGLTLRSLTLRNTTTASAFAIAPYIDADCCTPTNPSVAFGAAQAVGFSTNADDSISLAYNIGTISIGETVTFGYDYIMSVPIPEPETYAMLLAGLGLMGFMARRRKRT